MVSQHSRAKFDKPVVWFMGVIKVLAVGHARFDTPRLPSAAEIQGIESVSLHNTVETEQPSPPYVTTTRITIEKPTILVSTGGSWTHSVLTHASMCMRVYG